MRRVVGAMTSLAACLLLIAALAGPYASKPARDINIYYGSGAINPLFAGAFAVGALVAFAASRGEYVSDESWPGIVIGLGLFAFLVVFVWAVTARVDVFRAPGWAFPAQRWILVGLSSLIVIGAAWHTWANGHHPVAGGGARRGRSRR